MSSNDNQREVWREISQQVKNHSQNGRQRVGLTPTEGNEAYKRSSTRSSKRSRSERTSYLMATGHLDIEETRQLTTGQQKCVGPSDNAAGGSAAGARSYKESTAIYSPAATALPMNGQFGPSAGDQALRQYAASRHPFPESHDNIFPARSSSSSSKGNKDRDRFRQTYTEVRLPMKTSPAFEYILKDNKRRNKRCCLGLVYSTLIIICVAIIVFCSIQLLLRCRS